MSPLRTRCRCKVDQDLGQRKVYIRGNWCFKCLTVPSGNNELTKPLRTWRRRKVDHGLGQRKVYVRGLGAGARHAEAWGGVRCASKVTGALCT